MTAAVPDNMHRFNLTALHLFARLHESFPKPIEINPGHIGIDAAPPELPSEETFGFGAEAHHVVAWLVEEGFLRVGGSDLQGNFFEARLTLKGLAILGHTPSALQSQDPKPSMIERIKKVLVGGVEKAGTEAAKTLVTELFKLALAYGSAPAAGVGLLTT